VTLDLRRLRVGEIVAAVSALALFASMFLSWYGLAGVSDRTARLIAGAGQDTTDSAWQAFGLLDFYLLLVVLVALGLAILTAAERAPALPVAAGVVSLLVSGIGALLILVRLLDQPGPNDAVDVRYGAYLGLAAAIGVAVGSFLSMHDEDPGLGRDRARVEAEIAARGVPVRPAPPPATAETGGSAPPPGSSPPPSRA
jgi:hypothetical protein